MTKCQWKPKDCTKDAIPCIKGWTEPNGKIIIALCLEHEEESHRRSKGIEI